ncbi:MAG: hypothetical protein OHK0015_42840 [Chloroflexi bacterium OHK40]
MTQALYRRAAVVMVTVSCEITAMALHGFGPLPQLHHAPELAVEAVGLRPGRERHRHATVNIR